METYADHLSFFLPVMNHTIHNVYDSLFINITWRLFSMLVCNFSLIVSRSWILLCKVWTNHLSLSLFFSWWAFKFFQFCNSQYVFQYFDRYITRLDIRSGFADRWRRPFIMLDLSIYSPTDRMYEHVSNTCQECLFSVFKNLSIGGLLFAVFYVWVRLNI